MYSLQVLQTTEELNCYMTLLMNWKTYFSPRARVPIYTSIFQLHFSRQPNPEKGLFMTTSKHEAQRKIHKSKIEGEKHHQCQYANI